MADRFFKKASEFLMTEKRLQIKRKYREYSSKTINTNAPLRNEILKYVDSKGSVTKEELKEYMANMEESFGKKPKGDWYKTNTKYFKESYGKIRLSKLGKRIIDSITIKED